MKIKSFEKTPQDSLYYPGMKVIDLGKIAFYRKKFNGHFTGHIKRYSSDFDQYITKELVINKYVL